MSVPVICWIALAVILLIIEAATVQLVTVWFSAGAVAAALAAVASPDGILLQVIVFVAVSGILLAVTKPFVKKLTKSKISPTNADRVIGASGVVTVKLDPVSGGGQIKVMGQEWSARAESGEVIEVGERVEIVGLSGVKAVVRRLGAENAQTDERESAANRV